MTPGVVRFSWRPAARAARYTLMVDRRRMNTGCATRARMRVGVGSHSYRVIAENRYGTRSTRPRGFKAIPAPSVNEIRRGLGLDVLGKDAVAAAERITLQAAEAAALRSSLRKVGKFAGKASILGFLVSLGLEDGDLSCEQGRLYKRAKPTFALASDLLGRVSRAGRGPNRLLSTKLTDAQSALDELRRFIAGNHVIKECKGPNKVALATIKTLKPALAAAGKHLKALSAKPSKKACMTAQKLLKEYARIYEKVVRKPMPRKLKERLDRKQKDGTITSADLPKPVRDKFPGELAGYTLDQIKALCT